MHSAPSSSLSFKACLNNCITSCCSMSSRRNTSLPTRACEIANDSYNVRLPAQAETFILPDGTLWGAVATSLLTSGFYLACTY